MVKPIERTTSQDQGSISPVHDAHGDLVTNNVIVDETIEAIGFGKFQWQLTFSCGFGFLVDQVRYASQHFSGNLTLTVAQIDASRLH